MIDKLINLKQRRKEPTCFIKRKARDNQNK